MCEIVNEIIYFVTIAPFLYVQTKREWTQIIQNAYIGIILLNTLFLALVSLIFFIVSLIRMAKVCKKKAKSKQRSAQVNRINVSNRAEGEFSNVGSFAPVNNTRSETETPKHNYEEFGKDKIHIKKRIRANNHKLFTDQR